jgi:hypothetical protein
MEQEPTVSRALVLERAWQLLQDGQPRTAKEIAAALGRLGMVGVDKSLVNSVFAREGKGGVVYDRAAYTYTLADPAAPPPDVSDLPPPAPRAGEPAPDPAAPAADRAAVLAAARALLLDGQPRTARQIATELVTGGISGVDKSLINSVLAREGKDLVTYDRTTYTYTIGH